MTDCVPEAHAGSWSMLLRGPDSDHSCQAALLEGTLSALGSRVGSVMEAAADVLTHLFGELP